MPRDEIKLLAALLKNDHRRLSSIITSGFDVNQKLTSDWTALYWAASNQIATILIKAGADPNIRDADGCSGAGRLTHFRRVDE